MQRQPGGDRFPLEKGPFVLSVHVGTLGHLHAQHACQFLDRCEVESTNANCIPVPLLLSLFPATDDDFLLPARRDDWVLCFISPFRN